MSYHHTTHPPRLRVNGLLAGAVLATLVGGWAAGVAGAAAPDFDADAYCAAVLAIETVPDPEVDWESASEEEIGEAVTAWVSDVLRPLLDDVSAVAPPELADVIATYDAAITELEETGDVSVFESEEIAAAEAQAHAFDLETCGWNVVDVEAADYRFDNLPDEVPAGVTSLELTNTGSELHEIVVLRLADEATQPLEELLELPDEEVDELITFIAVTMADPGDSSYAVAELEPGRHVAICFVPVGLEEGGAPHFMEGMVAEFTVVE